MSGGTQSPPLENTSSVDPMGDVNVHGDKAKGEKDANQRSEQFGEGTESKKGGGAAGEDIMEASKIAAESARLFESGRKDL